MKKLRIIIEVEGGIVQAVYANESLKGQLDIQVLDHDNLEAGDEDEFYKEQKKHALQLKEEIKHMAQVMD